MHIRRRRLFGLTRSREQDHIQIHDSAHHGLGHFVVAGRRRCNHVRTGNRTGKQSSVVPLLLTIVLIGAFVVGIVYVIIESRRVLTTSEATTMVTTILNARAPAVRFETGTIKDTYGENARDPGNRLLERLEVIRMTKAKGGLRIVITDKGSELLKQIPDVKRTKNSEGVESYTVPLAHPKLISVSKVTMDGPRRATVEYSWQWDPNALGESFDAKGQAVKSFNMWDRSTLIDKYGVRFYHADPMLVSVVLAKGKEGWQIANE